MHRNNFLILILVFAFATCSRYQTGSRQEQAAITGCWKGRLLSPFNRPFSEMIQFSLRPDSSLALSMFYELGPRSRVWTSDNDVEVQKGTVVWADHEGVLNATRDTMTVSFKESWGTSEWLYVRDRSADSFMIKLDTYTAEPYSYQAPRNSNDGWQCANLFESGIDPSIIIDLVEEIQEGDHGDIHSFLIAKDNKLIVEEYFAENGTKHGSFITELFRNKVHHLASTTKSVTSILVGIAIDKGFIKSVEDPIYIYLPSYTALFNDDKKRIKIRDMLTMTPGFEWHQFGVSDDKNDGMQMWRADDVIQFVLQKPLEADPGKKFNYTNGVPTVTGAIIKNAVGMEVREFAEKDLFNPLEITDYIWTSYPDGSIETDGGLALRSRDLAKIGQLFLNKGTWNGNRIISEDWVIESTKEHLKFGKASQWGYGYHWMQADVRFGDRKIHTYFVPGDGNQILAVFPQFEMVVMFTAGNYGKDPKPIYFSIFEEFILPFVMH